jgi:hypothetical protein
MASIKSMEKILGSPVLHLQVRQRSPVVIVTDEIDPARALHALQRSAPQKKPEKNPKKLNK